MIEDEQGAMKLAELIENAADNPEKAAKRMEAKTGAKAKGIIRTILDFIKDYKNKDPAQSNEAWLEQQFAKQEYAEAWQGNEEERAAAAKGLVQGVEDYENAKKSLRTHIDLGGTRESWLARQILIGAEINGKDPEEYAKEAAEGLNAAREENLEFLLDVNGGEKEAV